MIDLFRFISLRPAAVPAPTQTIPVEPSASLMKRLGVLLERRAPAQEVSTEARDLLAAGAGVVTSTAALAYSDSYARFMTVVSSAGDSPPAGVAQRITQNFGQNAATLVTSPGFIKDQAAVSDTLILVKLASTSAGIDVAGLSTALQAIAIVESVAAGVTAPSLTPVFVLSGLPLARAPLPPAKIQPPAPPAPKQPPTAAQPTPAHDLAAAIRSLTSVPATSLQPVEMPRALPAGNPGTKAAQPAKTTQAPAGKAKQASLSAAPARQVLAIPGAVARTLDPAVARAADRLHLDIFHMSVPELVNAMSDALVRADGTIGSPGSQPIVPVMPGQPDAQEGLGGDPGTGQLPPLPTQPAGIVTPVGIGDLLVVKQRPLRYEGGDVAHIENILRSESFKRDTKRIDLTQTTVSTETDMTTEQEQDTQTTDRFALQRETANTITQAASLKAGVSVSSSYGPTVSVKANLDAAASSSQQDSTKVSTSYSQDVTSRASSKITQTTKQIQTMLTSNSFEEDISHGFDNTSGPGNISGVYQWVNKVYQAQVYNYGRRVMFDVMVPEPAAFLIAALATQPSTGDLPAKPPAFLTLPEQITDTVGDPNNYQALAALYGTSSLDPPPEQYVVVSAEYVSPDNIDPTNFSVIKDTLQIPDGWNAYSVESSFLFDGQNEATLTVDVGSASMGRAIGSLVTDHRAQPMRAEVGNVPVILSSSGMRGYAVSLELYCQRTYRSYMVWQEKVHAAIMQDYQRQLDAYEKALSDAAVNASPARGHNPLLNSQLQQQELKKACITLIGGQQYEAFGAIELSSPEGYPEVLPANISEQGRYVRFLEEAFEWDQMMYFYYPYYWGRKGRWTRHLLATDPDPQFSDFLDSGYARVVFPVRLNYEHEVIHLLESGLVYDGGDVPPIHSQQYVSIITELQEQEGAPGTEKPQGDPWEVTLPTTLVKLRKDDQLPEWHWDNSIPPQWIEVHPE